MFGWLTKRLPASPVAGDAIAAIAECDFELAESLRGTLTREHISEIVDTYFRLRDWPAKDIAIHLLQDCKPSQVHEVMVDALKSPTAESRAIAYCSLIGDLNHYSTFLCDGVVDAHLVDRAIAAKFNA
ncbi:hypothetical protein BH11PLA2_BH11PLA2_39920 [soil metagenome]